MKVLVTGGAGYIGAHMRRAYYPATTCVSDELSNASSETLRKVEGDYY